MPSAKKTPELLSIGDLAHATGVSPDTIRVWERRYGTPKPVRLPSGHRRYTPDQLRWLRRVVEAISLGYRPGLVVRAVEDELSRLLETRRTKPEPPTDVHELLERVRQFDAAGLEERLRSQYDSHGVARFLANDLPGLLVAMGRAWSDGRLQIRHEHFLTEVLQDLLRSLRLHMPTAPSAPRVLICSLENDLHDLPVQMGALLCSQMGLNPRILGRDTPLEEIVAGAREMAVRGVAVPTSLSHSSRELEGKIQRLRDLLPSSIALAVGWHDARFTQRPRRGLRLVRELGDLELWLRDLL